MTAKLCYMTPCGARRRKEKSVSAEDVKYLGLIDRMKSRLIDPGSAERVLSRQVDAKRAAATYLLYEEELRRINAMDFNSLIFEAYRLVTTYAAIAARYHRSYPYWLIDEFQDTNSAQYKLLRALARNEFRNLFAVADDDLFTSGTARATSRSNPSSPISQLS